MNQMKPGTEVGPGETSDVTIGKSNARMGKDDKPVKDSSISKCLTVGDGDTPQKVSFEHLLDISAVDGRWIFYMFLMCSFSGFNSPFQVLTYQFLGATPDHWCQVEELYASNWTDEQVLSLAIPFENATGKYDSCRMYDLNYTAAVTLGYEDSLAHRASLSLARDSSKKTTISSCPHGHSFNLTLYSSTVVTEWDLVCERRALYSTTFAAVSIGKMMGYLFAGSILDFFGRRPVVLFCVTCCISSGFLCSLAPSILVYIICRVIISIMDVGVYLGSFILMMEISPLHRRSQLGALFCVPWALGYMVTPGIAYCVRTWKLLQAALTLPSLWTLIYFKYLPESPRWLILHGRIEGAYSVLKWGSEVNGNTIRPKDEMFQYMEKIHKDVMTRDDKGDKCNGKNLLSRAVHSLKDTAVLYIIPKTRRHILVMLFCWFSVSMVYYGTALNATNLSTDPYLFVFLGGLLELPSYFLLWWAVAVIGRKKTFIGLYLAGSIFILLITTLLVVGTNGVTWPTVALAHAGKFMITSAFHLAFVYTAELFPTKYRPLAVSQSSACARIGSFFSPYINDMLGTVAIWAPSALFGGISLIAAILATTLPETKDQELPETSFFRKKEAETKQTEGTTHL
ncbi:organic cation transporter protein-like isoform X2 [Macrobrachium nipponense]